MKKQWTSRYQRAQAQASASRARRAQAAQAARRPTPAARIPEHIEFKALDVALNGTFSTTPVIACLNAPAPGAAMNQRVGREIMIRSIEVRLTATSDSGAAGALGGIWNRCIIFYDRQTNAAAPAVTDLLTAADCWAPRNLDNRHRFTILHDTRFFLSPVTPALDTLHHDLSWYRRMHHPTTYNAVGGGTVADITSGGLFLLIFGTEAPASNPPISAGYARIRYTDD